MESRFPSHGSDASATVAAPARALASAARLHGVDALRGVAAVLVMLFHYTTRYQEKFGHVEPPSFDVPWGHLGVNLFFMISGFVIFMTLERTTRPSDFLVSRFSRLYPAYWVAALLAFAIGRAVPELGAHVTDTQAAANGLMFHNLLGVPNIDGVYWTLEVELLFYWAMFLLWLTVGFASSRRWLAVWLALSVLSALGNRFGLPTPYIVSRVLILAYFPYFALGILVYRYFMQRQFTWRADGGLGVAALAAIALVDTPLRMVWACAFLALFALVAFRWASNAAVRALAQLGAVSYPLYLVHETMGWALIRNLEARGIGTDAAIAAAIAAALAMATLLHVAVEAPAMKWLRAAWKRRTLHRVDTDSAAALHRRAWAVGTLLIGAAVLVGNRLALVH